MSHLWTAEALVAAVDGRPIGSMPEGISGISIDSRSLQPGEAFFAIKGDTMDGHDFATAAIKAGAGVLVVAEGKLPALGRLTAPMIVVPDVLAALEKLGIASRARSRARIIAVTGSVGKTSTKEALRHVLSTVGKVHASAASFNNHWGVPLTLARMPQDTDYGVFEIGMNHPDEIRPLVKMVRPHVAIITVIAAAHLASSAISMRSPEPRQRFSKDWSLKAPHCSTVTIRVRHCSPSWRGRWVLPTSSALAKHSGRPIA